MKARTQCMWDVLVGTFSTGILVLSAYNFAFRAKYRPCDGHSSPPAMPCIDEIYVYKYMYMYTCSVLGICFVYITPILAAIINTGHAAAGTRTAKRKPAMYTQ